MALATEIGGSLNTLNDKCTIAIGSHIIKLKILPEISDSKSAAYSDTTIVGRSFPIKTFSHGENRVIGMKLHFLVINPATDIDTVTKDLYAIESAVYPREGSPYKPPPVCKIDCGKMLGKNPLCAILQSYNASFPTNVAWDQDQLMPYYFTLDTTWHVVYATDDGDGLPNQDRILQSGN